MKQVGVSFTCDRCGYTDFKFVAVDGDCTNMTINEAIRNCEIPKEWTLDLNNRSFEGFENQSKVNVRYFKLLCPKCSREFKNTIDLFYNPPVCRKQTD